MLTVFDFVWINKKLLIIISYQISSILPEKQKEKKRQTLFIKHHLYSFYIHS